VFGYTGDRRIKVVVEIYGTESIGDRRALIGRVLDSSDPIAQRWVGRPITGKYQNPILYLPDD
jgi:hypothetical protein